MLERTAFEEHTGRGPDKKDCGTFVDTLADKSAKLWVGTHSFS